MRNPFFFLVVAMIAIVIAYWWIGRPKESSRFRVKEARRKRSATSDPESDLGSARIKKNKFSLPGFNFDGSPHEVLGISNQASDEEIQTAYRKLMKRFHPDKVGRPDSREWRDAQAIATKITQARDALLKIKR